MCLSNRLGGRARGARAALQRVATGRIGIRVCASDRERSLFCRGRFAVSMGPPVVSVATSPCGTMKSNGALGAITLRRTVSSYPGRTYMCVPGKICLAKSLGLRDGVRLCLRRKTMLRNARGPRSCLPGV